MFPLKPRQALILANFSWGSAIELMTLKDPTTGDCQYVHYYAYVY